MGRWVATACGNRSQAARAPPWGVRFIVTSTECDQPLRKAGGCTLRFGDRIGVRLYELSGVNVGNYSPVDVVTASTAPEMVKRLVDPAIDLEQQVILAKPLGAPVVPAEIGMMAFINGGVQVEGKSSGKSILLLPLQYSHALRVQSEDHVELFRANLLETASLFDRKVDAFVSLDFGLGSVAGRRERSC